MARKENFSLEQKLKHTKPTKLCKLFVDILKHQNSYLILMQVSEMIKNKIIASTKELYKQKNELLTGKSKL